MNLFPYFQSAVNVSSITFIMSFSLTFFTDNKLVFSDQSRFKPDDYYVNQLIAITHEIYKSFDDGLEVRGVFLDISKAFDKG